MTRSGPASKIELVWEEPPSVSPIAPYRAVLDEIKANPGRWARVRVVSQASAYTTRKRLLKHLDDDNRWQVSAGKLADDANRYGIWIRYRTEAQMNGTQS